MKKIVILFLFLIFLSILPVHEDFPTNVGEAMLPMSAKHPLGTDNLGRDLFELMKFGGKRTAQTILVASMTALIPGLIFGFIAGYHKNLLGKALEMAGYFGLIVPSFIIAVIISSLWGFNPITIGISLGVFDMATYGIQVAKLTEKIQREDFVKMSEFLGLSKRKIFEHHILPHVFGPISAIFGAKASSVVLRYASLAFLGLGSDVSKPDWGMLLYEYRIYFLHRPWLLIWPALGIFLFCILFHVSFDKSNPYYRSSL